MRTTLPQRGILCLGAAWLALCAATSWEARGGAALPPPQRETRASMVLSDQALPPLHLKSHVVTVEITGRTARVATESVYRNGTARDLEATYLFPLPDGATVERFTMWMDGQPVDGKVAEKDRVRSTYEGIVAKRKDPGIVEQIGENLFRCRIFPVRAHQDQRVRMEYSQILPLSAKGNAVSFSYPLYCPAPRDVSSAVARDFLLAATLEMESPIASIASPSHKISCRVLPDDARKARVSLEEAFTALDRDFDLKVELQQKALPITSLAYRSAPAAPRDQPAVAQQAENGTLMLFITPQLPEGEEVTPKDVVLVMDISGSMAGQKIEQARAALRECLQRLRPKDRFALVAFSDYVRTLHDTWRECSGVNLAQAENFVLSLREGGATNIEEALQKALSYPPQEGRLRQILFATDGLPTMGNQDTNALVALVAPEDRGVPPRFFTFGIGYDVNTVLLDRIAGVTGGDRAYVKENERIDAKIAQLCDKIASPVLTDVKLEFSANLGVEQIYPPKLGDLYLRRQAVVTARYRTPGNGNVVVKGKRGGKDVTIEAALALPAETVQATACLPKQWATRKVGFLLDQMRLHGENAELRDEVVRLGTKHSIVTPYTSYLALEAPDRARFDAETERLEEQRAARRPAVASKLDSPATDPRSSEASDIVVPPDILAQTQLGDHWETVNPDRPDTHSVFGNPDAAGGGGMGGNTLEELIGVGGGASPGSGGGWGGGYGVGSGMDIASGRSSFGQRNGGGRRLMVKRHGGSRATESAVDQALRWLAYHQEADGHWDSSRYGADVKTDTVATSLALLSFLGAGHTEKVGEHKGNVQRAVAWLKSKQQTDGRIFDAKDAGGTGTQRNVPVAHSSGPPEAIAALALAEAAGMANVPDTKAAAQRALDYCTEVHQCGEGADKSGWGYEARSEPNIMATGWFVMALKSAKVAGLRVPPASFDGAIKFLDTLERKDHATGVSVYWYSRLEERPERAHVQTAIGTLCRQLLGWKKEELEGSVDWFIGKGGVPSWGTNGEQVDLAHWYSGTLSVFQQGGDMWKRWNEALKAALAENQRKEGDEAGSWGFLRGMGTAPTAAQSSLSMGRVGQTALACLCLETYYRYLQLQPDVGRVDNPPHAPVNVPKSESGKDAVDYSEFIRRLQEGETGR